MQLQRHKPMNSLFTRKREKAPKKYRIVELIDEHTINPAEVKREIREHFNMAERTFHYKLHARENQPYQFNTAQLLYIAKKIGVPVAELYQPQTQPA